MAQSLGGWQRPSAVPGGAGAFQRGRHRGPGGGVGHGMRSVRVLRDPAGMQGGAGMMRIIICIIFCGPLKKRAVWNMRTCPGRFLEVCRRKSDYLGQLNRNLGRATMNLTWKNRFLESRAAVMTQFEELAGILEEFSGQMEQALDVTMTWEGELKTALRKRRIDVEGLLVLQYGQGRREVFMTAR